MYQGQAVAVVVPAHNEEKLVGRTIASLPDFVDHVILVDDGSTDRTPERGALAALGRPDFTLVVHPDNRGVGAAILSGYRRALQLHADVAVVVGADAQMDPDDMPALLEAVRQDGAQYAKGDRFSFPGVARTMPTVRLLGNAVLSLLTRVTSGYWRLRELFSSGDITIPSDNQLMGELAALRYSYDSQGRILMESKDAMRQRGLPSPDKADALMLAFLAPPGRTRLWT